MNSNPKDWEKTILVVDDTTENIDILRVALGPHYRVKVATHGRLALKIATTSPAPDLILLDVMMPGLDGYAVCRLLKANASTQAIPVIFVTTRSEVADEAMGFALGAADYIVKPLSPPIVLARVKTHLALADQRRHLEDLVQERTRALERRSQELEETHIEMIQQLGRAAEFRDNETGMHVQRMSHYCRLLGLATGMTPQEADQLRYAAMMHDIGKIGIPDHILLKPGKLTADEFAVIKRHPTIGAGIIGPQKVELLRLAQSIALSHHEKWDGGGYPQGLMGEAIPLEGRITALADVFDALVSKRPYKEPWPLDKALGLLEEGAGAHFDPRLSALFLALRPQVVEIMHTYEDES